MGMIDAHDCISVMCIVSLISFAVGIALGTFVERSYQLDLQLKSRETEERK